MREQMTRFGRMAEENMVKESECILADGEVQCSENCAESGKNKSILADNRGVGVVEVILILVVLIALVLIFKEQLGTMVTKAMEALEKSMNEVLS